MHGGISGKQGVHNGVGVGQDLLYVVLNRFWIDPHMAGSMTILCDARRIDFRILSEARQCVVARHKDADVGVSSDSTCLV
jgi:hypothetical protein